MDSVKLSAALIALTFILATALLLNMRSLFLTSTTQLIELKNSISDVKIEVTLSQSNLTMSITNPFNISMYAYNAKGDYVTLERPVKIDPMSTGNLTFIINNTTGFFSLEKTNRENITLFLGLGKVNFTQSVNI
ncbi:MAG: hypothetical protein QXR57_00170 [Metallosphaera sp.]|nr:hypothetical protein [Metallosphaera cuprina]